jgi:two-component system, cell cycle sensor histidine kinase and response regulator CckA
MDATTPTIPAVTLLIVDDEPLMTQILSLQMTKQGFHALVADSAREALKIIDAAETPIDLIITDMSMPEMDGTALAQALYDRSLDIPVLIASGYPADEAAGLPPNVVGVVEKPFQYKALAERIRQILETNA